MMMDVRHFSVLACTIIVLTVLFIEIVVIVIIMILSPLPQLCSRARFLRTTAFAVTSHAVDQTIDMTVDPANPCPPASTSPRSPGPASTSATLLSAEPTTHADFALYSDINRNLRRGFATSARAKALSTCIILTTSQERAKTVRLHLPTA
jgi:hypothetical protein